MVHLKPIDRQVIVVVGASSGIGRATALEAARRGAMVVIAARGGEALRATEREITAGGGQVAVSITDVSDFAQVQALGQAALDRFGRVDTWVNAAAVSVYGEFLDVPMAEFRRVIEVNLLGVVHGTRVALELLREQGGTIVNVSSAVGDQAIPLQSAYYAAKFAINGFDESVREEIAHAGLPVQLTTIKPASIDTPFFHHARSRMGVEPKPLPPVYAPEIVAAAILHAATHPVRELPVGGAAAWMAFARRLMPALTEKQLSLAGYPMQQTDKPERDDPRDNLYQGAPGPGAVHGGYDGRTWSAYTWWRLKPPIARFGFAGAAVAGLAALRRRV
jgi:short-subunit dehydrogenase